jgi:predicted aspartyl protease
MGKVIEKVKRTSVFDTKKWAEVEAVIDTGATRVVLPKNLVQERGLEKIESKICRWKGGEKRSVWCGPVKVEGEGR